MSKNNKKIVAETVYFEKPGKANTDDTLHLAKQRVEERGIKHVVVASTTGRVGVKAAEVFKGADVELLIVSEHFGFKDEGKWMMKDEYLQQLEEMSIEVITQSHILSGLERSISKKLGGGSRTEAIADALRWVIGVGVKVCVEIAIMAADSGKIPCGQDVEIMAIAGYSGGADTAVIIRPAHMNNFFDLEVREYVCLPRMHKPAYKSN